MQRLISILSIVAIVIAFNFISARASNAPVAPVPVVAGGTITGCVVDADGKVIGAGIEVKLFAHEKHAHGAHQQAAGAHQRPAAIATATTDANGNFSFPGIAAGEYMVIAHDKGVGHGHAAVNLPDAANASANATITLEKGKGGKGACKPKAAANT